MGYPQQLVGFGSGKAENQMDDNYRGTTMTMETHSYQETYGGLLKSGGLPQKFIQN